MRNGRRSRAAAKHNRHAGGQSFFKSLFREPKAAVPAASRPQIFLFQGDQIVKRYNERKLFLQQDFYARIIKFEQMVGGVDAGGQAAIHPFASIGVTRHLQS